jgi:DNA-binding IclR family transcriptional regulator
MSADSQYISEAQQRILGLILVLAGNEIEGLAPSQIAKLNICSASQVTRDLANLKAKGWAEQIATTGRWRLGPEIVQVSMRHLTALDRAKTRLDEARNRFTPGAA